MVCLCLSSRTHTLSCVVCRGAVVLPMQKKDVPGWGPSFPFLSLLPGWSHTPSLVSVGGAGWELVAPPVCAAWHDMVTYWRGSLLSLLIFSCDACLVAVMLLACVLHTYLTHNFACLVCRGVVVPPMEKGVRRRVFCHAMASCHCHLRLVSYSCGGVVCYLLMPRTCSPLSFFVPCCAYYGVL